MYIDDCLEGTLRLAAGDVTEPLNIGSSELVSINQLVSIVEEIASIELERHYQPDAPIGVAGRNSDNTKVRACLDWEPSIPLRDGLEKTYKWIYDAYLRRYAGHVGPRSAAPRGAHVKGGS
jgi:nucleoside-diphosphate-sugar epimerase